MFHYFLLGGGTAIPSRLYTRLCHEFLVSVFVLLAFFSGVILNCARLPQKEKKIIGITEAGVLEALTLVQSLSSEHRRDYTIISIMCVFFWCMCCIVYKPAHHV